MKLGLSFNKSLYSVPSAGFLAIMLPATEAPVAISCVCPATKAATVALLSSKRLMSAPAGASLVNSWSSRAPRVTPTLLPPKSAKLFTFMLLAANTA